MYPLYAPSGVSIGVGGASITLDNFQRELQTIHSTHRDTLVYIVRVIRASRRLSYVNFIDAVAFWLSGRVPVS